VDPDEVAHGIELCAESPKAEVSYGRAGRALEVLYALAPRLYCRTAPVAFMRGTMTDDEEGPTDGNVLTGTDPYEVSGRWRRDRRPTLRRALLAAVIGGFAGLAGARASLPRQRR
jgi:hypothetical protein